MAWARHIFPCKIPHIGGPYLYTFSTNPHEVRRLIKFHIITDLKRCFYNCKHCVYMKKTLQVLKSAPCGFFFFYAYHFYLLQGPALYAYNNAMFTKEDWKGIRMLCDSIKVKDPMKVGRFGLGFKSVFHVTGEIIIIYL